MLVVVEVLKTYDNMRNPGNDNHVDAKHPLDEFATLCLEKTCVSDVPARYVARSNIEARDADFS